MSAEWVIILLFIAFEVGRWTALFEISRILKLQARTQRRASVKAGRRLRRRLQPPRLPHDIESINPADPGG